jgi:hypothetical protein
VRRWLQFLRRHQCELPTTPPSFALPSDFDQGELSFSCSVCGREWKLTWVEDIVEYTIASPADIGEWHWRAV